MFSLYSLVVLLQVVVIIVIWIISLLVIYMLFLVCLDPLLNKKTTQYQEQTNEEVSRSTFPLPFFPILCPILFSCTDRNSTKKMNLLIMTHSRQMILSNMFQEEAGANAQPLRVSGTGVLNRVSHTQDKWKRQVQEQRRHIYDRHTILN